MKLKPKMKSYWTEIMHANFNLLTLLLIVDIKEQSVSAEFRTIPDPLNGLVVVPSELQPPSSTATLRCILTISPDVNYEAQWIGPGEVGLINTSTSDRYTIANTTFELLNGPPHWTRTELTIHELSYQDAGVYICTGRMLVELNELASPWMSATLNLQLDVDLLSKFNETVVMATTADSTVELSCEMRAFIRPDSSLIWEGPDNQRLIGGTEKYQITFSNGSSDTAVNGTLVPSRVSTLTILNPEKSDQGVYTCSIIGTNKTIDLLIMINDMKATPTSVTSSRTDATTTATADLAVGGVGTTQRNTAKSWYCYANILATFVVMSIGVLIQHCI